MDRQDRRIKVWIPVSSLESQAAATAAHRNVIAKKKNPERKRKPPKWMSDYVEETEEGVDERASEGVDERASEGVDERVPPPLSLLPPPPPLPPSPSFSLRPRPPFSPDKIHHFPLRAFQFIQNQIKLSQRIHHDDGDSLEYDESDFSKHYFQQKGFKKRR